jgi:hypothetical protein
MIQFPAADPIPLPAPVWLLKALHIVTLSLHFVAVEMLLGGLLVACALCLFSKGAEGSVTTRALARRMPVVMTYVINFGVPPLLFAQVLYGRALYTSSVLIGAYWISVIFLLMLCYWLLYQFSARLELGKRAWPLSLAAWIIAGFIARILSSNMTLMLRPEIWQSMYTGSASGTSLPTGDPTLIWRWLFMMTGGAMVAGLWLIYLSGRVTFAEVDQKYMARLGGILTAAGAVATAMMGLQVGASQPGAVQVELVSNLFYRVSGYAFLAVIFLVVATGLIVIVTKQVPKILTLSTPVLALLAMATATITRDGIRDITLALKGFNVWSQPVVTNWSIVLIFVVLFVLALVTLGWLVSVVARATKENESLAIL